MSIVPDFVMCMVEAHLAALLDWFSTRLYAEFLKRAPGHVLVELHTRLDMSGLERACAAFHHQSGPGAPATHSVARLVRALLVKQLYRWSLRELEWHVRFNLIVKWFVGYRLFDAGPDHVTLERFECWVATHQPRAFFDAVLQQIDRDFPDEREQPQVGDTFAMRADAAKESLIRLIRHSCERMLRDLRAASPERHLQMCDQFDRQALFGPQDEVSEHRLDEAGRQARLQTTVSAAQQCAHLLRGELERLPLLAEPVRSALQQHLQHLDKILSDHLHLTYAPDGHLLQVRELPKDQKGSYRSGSATDPDATYRVHGDNKSDFGYNISLAASPHFIREIRADTGAQPDPVAIPDLLSAQITHHDLCPGKLIYDAAAGTGKTHALVAQATHARTQLVAPLLPYDKRTQRFTPEDFVLSQDGRTLTCPNGQTATTAYRSGSGDGHNFRFLDCAGCPLAQRCRDPKSDPHAMRQVFISDYRRDLEIARAYTQTADFLSDLRRRPSIERIIACLTRYHGARRATRRGLPNADVQAKLAATIFNLKQWLTLLRAPVVPA